MHSAERRCKKLTLRLASIALLQTAPQRYGTTTFGWATTFTSSNLGEPSLVKLDELDVVTRAVLVGRTIEGAPPSNGGYCVTVTAGTPSNTSFAVWR